MPVRPVSRTAVVINRTSLNYSRIGHIESAFRLKSILDYLDQKGLLRYLNILPERTASKEELRLAHDTEYIEKIFSWPSDKAFYSNDKWSPYSNKSSLASALTAAGSLIVLSEAVSKGEFENGFAIIRPPGHHATQNKAMGFCIFNNIAIAAKNLIIKNLAKKILIVDIDAHFGNGIADIFTHDTQVYYLSLNQKWIFPYSPGSSTDRIKDIKVDFLYPEEKHVQKFKEAVDNAIHEFSPDFIFVSAGFDSHWRDPMSNLSLSLTAYAEMSRFLVQSAKKVAQGKIVFSLEGGYDLDVLPIAVGNSLKILMGREDIEDPIGKKGDD